MSKKSRRWTPAVLKTRGWTNELMTALLPKPHRYYAAGRSVIYWSREDVAKAEETALFQEKSRGMRPGTQAAEAARADAARAAGDLTAAWEGAEKDESLPWVLAGRLHAAVLGHLPLAAQDRLIRDEQAKGYLGQFLSLERKCDPERLPGDLTRLVKAGPFLGANPKAPLSLRTREQYPAVLLAAAEAALADLTEKQPEADHAAFLNDPEFPEKQLLSRSLGTIWSVWYVPRAIRTSLSLLVALNPRDEYPEARAMRRKFILHIGGTNTGKTYAGFQRLRLARTGVYLAPLRLLALEAQETLIDAGVNCSLTTGEEEDCREGDTHVAATVEKLDLREKYDVAVIDECQMIADRERGYAWTRAILGVQAPEVHLCAAPEARDLLLRLIESCGDTCEVELHRRKAPLVCMDRCVDYTKVQPGDALITFSKIGVLSVAEDLRQEGKSPAIIYGALPYASRRRQMEGFLEGRMQYVVSTDAIGMGLNLPIRRILFMETEKFDGVERRPLKPEEIQQIAGRAGRFGMYDKGYVGAFRDLEHIRAGLQTVVPPLQTAIVGFSDLVLQVDFDLLEVLTEWNRMPTVAPYVKLDISRYISLISKMREMGFTLPKEQELRAANIPFDETEEPLRELFFDFLRLWQQGEEVPQPALPEEGVHTLPELELHCRKLDLYFSFSRAFDFPVDEDRLAEEREKTAEEINEILLYRLKNNIRFCARCGRALPLHHHGRLCDGCYRRTRQGRNSGHRKEYRRP